MEVHTFIHIMYLPGAMWHLNRRVAYTHVGVGLVIQLLLLLLLLLLQHLHLHSNNTK
jgi:hypothetical protein